MGDPPSQPPLLIRIGPSAYGGWEARLMAGRTGTIEVWAGGPYDTEGLAHTAAVHELSRRADDDRAPIPAELERLRAIEIAARQLVGLFDDLAADGAAAIAIRPLVGLPTLAALRVALGGPADHGDMACTEADRDPVLSVRALIGDGEVTGAVREALCAAIIDCIDEHTRELDVLGATQGLEPRTFAALRHFREGELCSLIAAIGGAL